MKRNTRRLSLDREIIKYLDRAELMPVNGGNTGSCLQTCVYSCNTRTISECRVCPIQ